MSIVSVHEKPGRTSSLNWKYQRTYKRTFQVISNTPFENPITVETATGIPLVQAQYPTDANALVESKTATQGTGDELYKWIVEVNYTTTFDREVSDYVENPLSRPAVYDITFERSTKAVQYDVDNQEIVNSADIPFDPPQEMPVSYMVITITKNRDTRDLVELGGLQDVVNSDSFLGFDPETLMLRIDGCPQKTENSVTFYEWKYVLTHRPEGWNRKLLDMGFQHFNDDDPPELVKFRDAWGDPFPNPSKLDGTGKELPEGDPPVFLSYWLSERIAFTGTVPTT